MKLRVERRLHAAHFLCALAALIAASPAWALDPTHAHWSDLACAVWEDVPRIFPDTRACYLAKEIEPRADAAYRPDFDLPYASYTTCDRNL